MYAVYWKVNVVQQLIMKPRRAIYGRMRPVGRGKNRGANLASAQLLATHLVAQQLHRVARRHEDHDLLVLVSLEEGEEE